MTKKQTKPDQLALDAAAAKAAGLSYGKWRAMQPPRKVETETPEGWCVCQHCGKKYKPKTRRPQKYCNYECQQQALYERNRKRKGEQHGKTENDRYEQAVCSQ